MDSTSCVSGRSRRRHPGWRGRLVPEYGLQTTRGGGIDGGSPGATWRQAGLPTPRRSGGAPFLQRALAHRDVILAAIDTQVDIIFVRLSGLLRQCYGASFRPNTIRHFSTGMG